jgi:hypothetical protein
MTRKVLAVGVALAALVLFALLPGARAGDKGLDVKGEIKIGNHALKMDAGRLYEIRVEGTGFRPVLSIDPGFFRIASPPGEKNVTTQFFVPPKTEQYRLYVTPDLFRLPEGALAYQLKVTRIPMSNKPLLKQEGKLTAADPAYENKNAFAKRPHHKAYKVTLEAGRFYIIDMVHKGKGGFGGIDPFLYLEDPAGKVEASDDDGGGFPDARIVFRPTKSGEYRIIATALGDALGEYTLTVRRQLKGKEE